MQGIGFWIEPGLHTLRLLQPMERFEMTKSPAKGIVGNRVWDCEAFGCVSVWGKGGRGGGEGGGWRSGKVVGWVQVGAWEEEGLGGGGSLMERSTFLWSVGLLCPGLSGGGPGERGGTLKF